MLDSIACPTGTGSDQTDSNRGKGGRVISLSFFFHVSLRLGRKRERPGNEIAIYVSKPTNLSSNTIIVMLKLM